MQGQGQAKQLGAILGSPQVLSALGESLGFLLLSAIPQKRGKVILQLPQKDDAVGDATLQKASKALPKCRDMLENISCSSHSHTLHSHLQTSVVYKFLIIFFLE